MEIRRSDFKHTARLIIKPKLSAPYFVLSTLSSKIGKPQQIVLRKQNYVYKRGLNVYSGNPLKLLTNVLTLEHILYYWDILEATFDEVNLKEELNGSI